MNIVAIVVIYKPIQFGIDKIKSNIASYSDYCNKIIIVDNSSDNNSFLFSDCSNICYIQNCNNGGIAGAQNKGCEKAIEEGYEWAITMDQDSFFEKEQIQQYFELVSNYISENKNTVSFSPRIVDLNESRYWTHLLRKYILGPLKRKLLHKTKTELPVIDFPTEVIASANIINLKAWLDAGKFDEQLFIEQVDYDFCHNLIKKGYKIVRFNSVFLNQYLGKRVFSLFKKNYPWYNNARMYYVFRNLFIEKYRFPEYSKKYKRIIRLRFIDYCLNTINPIYHIYVFIKAYKDYKQFYGN